MDSLKERHINRPKQAVYQTDVLNLTEKVEGYVRFRFHKTFKYTCISTFYLFVFTVNIAIFPP